MADGHGKHVARILCPRCNHDQLAFIDIHSERSERQYCQRCGSGFKTEVKVVCYGPRRKAEAK